jgi:branched-chain amino acid transport system ATP-binding protein
VLKISNLACNYGNIQALKDINLTLDKGMIVALLGANGAGKSTTLKAISGLMKLKAGSIEFNGENIAGKTTQKIVSMGIIHCPEGRQVFPDLTVWENLRIGTYGRKDKSGMKQDLEKVLHYFPRLEERLNQGAGTLSGGEQQMLAIGRALMAKPKLLLLDEPSLGLAPILVREIFNIIQQIQQEGTSILLVEQNVHMSLSVADYAYILETGKVTLHGHASQLQQNDDVRRSYLGQTS